MIVGVVGKWGATEGAGVTAPSSLCAGRRIRLFAPPAGLSSVRL
jgi:hypothetical protein